MAMIKSIYFSAGFTSLLLAPLSLPAATAVGATQVGLTPADNVYAIATSGTAPTRGGLDTAGYAYAANLLGTSVTWTGNTFAIGAATAPSAIANATVSPPTGNYSTLKLLAAGAFGPISGTVFSVTYTDGSTSSFTQSVSDWGKPGNFTGESIATTMTYRITPTGATQNGPWYVYGYSFPLNGSKTLQSITLPKQRSVVVLAIDLIQSAAPLTAQSITFSGISPQTVGAPLTLSATATSGLAVSLVSSTTSVCSVSSAVATFLAAGTCTITASQAGNATYAAAASVTQSFSVTKAAAAAQTITFNPIVTQTVSVPLTLSATASSGLAVTYTTSTPSVCTVADSSATFVSAGTCTLTASQSGSASYAAVSVSQSFSVQNAATAPGYDVVLLVGQSNMVGLGTGADDAGDAAADPRIFQWNANAGAITPAFDPLYQNSSPYNIGLGMTFAKAYVTHMQPNRKLLLVGAATGATGFAGGYWLTPNGTGVTGALSRINAAMAAAGSNARLAGILWHQGENDIGFSGGAAYQSNLQNLIAYFRANITGATSTTPFVAGEMVNAWLTYNLGSSDATAQQNIILNDIHTLPDVVPYTAWTSAAQLAGDPYYDTIHFSALAQRQFGRRYADKFFEAANNLPQPQVSQNWWAGSFYDDGRGLGSLSTNSIPINKSPSLIGTVTAVTDQLRGNVARFSQGQGWLSYQVPGNTFNGSYTKMAWFLPGAVGYGNNLVSGNNPGQIHFLFAQSLGNNQYSVAAGHSSGAVSLAVSAQVTNVPGAWMNVALSYDSNAQTMTLYLNGAAIASQSGVAPAPGLSAASVLPVLMGSFGYTGASAMDGEMAGGRVWNVALSAAQIAAIYNYESVGKGNEPGFGIVVGAASQAAQSPALPGIPYSVPSLVAATGGTAPAAPVAIVPNNGFNGLPTISLAGLPSGANYSLSPGDTANNFTLQISGLSTSSAVGRYPLVLSGKSGTANAQAAATLCISARDSSGNLQVDLSCFFNRGHNLVTDGTTFSDGGLAGAGYAFSANLLGNTVNSGNVQFSLGTPNGMNGLSAATVNVPAGQYTKLALLGSGINGAQTAQPFTISYSDGTTSTITVSLSDWSAPQSYTGESVASSMPYVDVSNGTRVTATLNLYSYTLALNGSKTLTSITVPNNYNVVIMAMTLVGTIK